MMIMQYNIIMEKNGKKLPDDYFKRNFKPH